MPKNKTNDSSEDEWTPSPTKRTKIKTSSNGENKQACRPITRFLSKKSSSREHSKSTCISTKLILKPRLSIPLETSSDEKSLRSSERVRDKKFKKLEKQPKYNEQRNGHIIYNGKLKYSSYPIINPPSNFKSFPVYLPNYSTAIKHKNSFDCFGFKTFCGINGYTERKIKSNEMHVGPRFSVKGFIDVRPKPKLKEDNLIPINECIIIQVTNKSDTNTQNGENLTFICCLKKRLKRVPYFSVFIDERSELGCLIWGLGLYVEYFIFVMTYTISRVVHKPPYKTP